MFFQHLSSGVLFLHLYMKLCNYWGCSQSRYDTDSVTAKVQVFFFSVKNFIFKTLPSVAYFINTQKVEFGISYFRATKFREKR